jgi:thiamine kinase-like enzyme
MNKEKESADLQSASLSHSKNASKGVSLVNRSWLQKVFRNNGLDTRIEKISLVPIGTGQLGSTVRISIAYANGYDGPDSLVLKFDADDATSLDVARHWSLYKREVNFYNQLAKRVSISLPKCFYAEEFDNGQFLLLMEDLRDYSAGDQMRGTSLDVIRQAVSEAAKLHSSTWHIDAEKYPWLDAGYLAQPFYSAEVYRDVWPRFYDRYKEQLSPGQVSVCENFAQAYEAYQRVPDSPRCVTHNDFRPDNMLYHPSGDLKVVDWQSVAFGYGAVDVAYLLGGAFPADERQQVEGELLAHYLKVLRQEGVEDYSAAQLQRDYAHFAFAGINVAVGAAMLVKRTDRGDRLFLTMLDRHVQHVLDRQSMALIS